MLRRDSSAVRENLSEYLGFSVEPVLHGVAFHPSALFVKMRA